MMSIALKMLLLAFLASFSLAYEGDRPARLTAGVPSAYPFPGRFNTACILFLIIETPLVV
jgi:hypothetical protein